MLLDTHHHLDFLPPTIREQFLAGLRDRGVQIVAQTLTPSGFMDVVSGAREGNRQLVAVGFHPWWIGVEDEVERELALVPRALQLTRFMGEIGLDLSPRRLARVPADRQLQVLRRVLAMVREAASSAPVVASIHAVRSVGQVLDLLDEAEVIPDDVVPVFHRFSGTSDELTTAMRMGGYLAISPALLATRRGRAYAAQVPMDRLLLETDLPPAPVAEATVETATTAATAVVAALSSTLAALQELRSDDVATAIVDNQERLYRCEERRADQVESG